MKIPSVISVNPGVKTLGEFSQESKKYDHALPRLVSRITVTPRLKESLNFITGINTPDVSGTSGRIFLLRTVSAALLITSAVYLFNTSGISLLAIIISILGASLIFGFLTRPFAFASLSFFAFAAYSGLYDIPVCALLGFGSFIFMVTGPGIYSMDQYMRKSIFRSSRRRRANRHLRRIRRPAMTYKAYTEL